jgi:hypothetical protein
MVPLQQQQQQQRLQQPMQVKHSQQQQRRFVDGEWVDWSVRDSVKLTDAVGARAEAFVYLQLLQQMPALTPSCWVSSTRLQYIAAGAGGNSPGAAAAATAAAAAVDDSLGYDFVVEDTAAVFGGAVGEVTAVEVKGTNATSVDSGSTFFMSANEVACARRCAQARLLWQQQLQQQQQQGAVLEEGEVRDVVLPPTEPTHYVLVFVANCMRSPYIARTVANPAAQFGSTLALEPNNFKVTHM